MKKKKTFSKILDVEFKLKKGNFLSVVWVLIVAVREREREKKKRSVSCYFECLMWNQNKRMRKIVGSFLLGEIRNQQLREEKKPHQVKPETNKQKQKTKLNPKWWRWRRRRQRTTKKETRWWMKDGRGL